MWTGENDTKTISVDANLFKNGAKQVQFFSFENGLVRTGPKANLSDILATGEQMISGISLSNVTLFYSRSTAVDRVLRWASMNLFGFFSQYHLPEVPTFYG